MKELNELKTTTLLSYRGKAVEKRMDNKEKLAKALKGIKRSGEIVKSRMTKDVNEQHADVDRFKPVIPHNVKSVPTASPRRTSDSANVKLREEMNDTEEKNEMAQTQLHFIQYASKEIIDYIGMGGEIEEWYQNKLSKVHSDMEGLHSWVEGEKRRTGMVKEQSELDEGENKQVKDGDPCWKDYQMVGMKKKGGKQVPNCVPVKEETLEEGRPSQRHPLEGHEYHRKTDAELVYIAKDAHKAAEAMKSHNTTAENKYRDQANDSATVRYFRQKNGMPDWYKKKYGHVNEEVEQIDEISSKLANSYLAKKHERDYEKTSDNTYKTKNPMSMAQAHKSMTSTARALKRTKTNEEVESIEEVEDIHSHRVGDEVILKNKDYHGVIVKSKGSDISFKNKSDNKHYKATHSMIDRNLSQEKRYKERSAEKNKKFDDAMTSDMERIHKSGALKKFGIGVKEQVADAPFDPPYSKKTGSHTDKSGAVHGPMSTAKHLARMAAAKQARNLANPTPASKKSGIVREAIRDAKKRDEEKKEEKKVSKSGNDKFQPDPELNSQIIRTE